jgi:AcrR family transcriptional regulator
MSQVGTVKHDQILSAALGVFGRHGYRRTSMELIAQAAGVSRPSLYQYFGSKQEVFRAMSARMLDGVVEAAAMAGSGDAPVAERLCEVLSVKAEFFVGTIEAGFRRELLAEAASIAGDVAESFKERFVTVVEEVLASAGELDFTAAPVSAPDTAALLLDSLAGIMHETPDTDLLYQRLRHLVALTVSALSRPA